MIFYKMQHFDIKLSLTVFLIVEKTPQN